jgi:hypothetical protein
LAYGYSFAANDDGRGGRDIDFSEAENRLSIRRDAPCVAWLR